MMKYWLFDGDDVAGPFSPEELAARADFSAVSLIAPETNSEDQNDWKVASSFEEFEWDEETGALKIVPPPPQAQVPPQEQPSEPAQEAVQPEPEVPEESVLQAEPTVPQEPVVPAEPEETSIEPAEPEQAPADPEETPAEIADPEQVSVEPAAPEQEPQPIAPQPPQPPVQAVQPPPQQTSVPLAKSIALAETTEEILSLPVHAEPAEPEAGQTPQEMPAAEPLQVPAQEPVAEPLPETPAEPSEQETAPEPAPAQAEEAPPKTPTLLTRELPVSLSQLPTVDDISQENTGEEESNEEDPFENAEREVTLPSEFVPRELTAQKKETPTQDESSQIQELVLTAQSVAEKRPVQKAKEPQPPLRNTEPLTAPGIGVRNVLKPHLTQTPEINTFLHAQQEAHRPGRKKARWMLWILLILLIPGMVALAVYKKQPAAEPVAQEPASKPAPEPQSKPADKPAKKPQKKPSKEPATLPEKAISQKSVVQTEPEETVVPIPLPPAPLPLNEQAVEIVKDYQLSGNRGTVDSYLGRMYKTQLDSGGYVGEWSAEPLHKSIYIVKYRLTKTRNEPIVYVFQADVSKGKVIGALNNITLDLIGKI